MAEKPVWNNARMVDHQNFQRLTHPHSKRNFVPRAVLMKSGLKTLNTARQNSSRAAVSVNTARQINTAYLRPIVNYYEEIDGGFVAFGGSTKGGKITGKGRKPALSFMGPFRCHVTILNTLDHLSKFDGKADEGFFVGYSVNSKGFRVFNSRTRIVEETLQIIFLENKSNVAGSIKACENAGKARLETVPGKDYILLPFLTQDPPFFSSSKDSPNAGFKPSGDEEKKDAEHIENKVSEVPNTEEPRVNQEQDESVNNTNNINTVSSTVNTASIEDNVVDKNKVYGCVDDPNMPNLEEIVYSEDDEGVGVEADMNNLDTYMPVSPIPATRIHKDHPFKQIIIDLHLAPQTRRMTKSVTEHDDIIFGSTKKSLCTESEKLMHKKFQMRSMGELTFFLGLQMTQKDDGIFISQDKYVDEILKKFGFSTMKTASPPIQTLKPLMKDENAKDVDVHLYRSMIGSLMYLTSSRPDIMFVVCACTRFQVTPKDSHLHAMKRIFRYLKGQPKLGLWYPKDSPFYLEAYTDMTNGAIDDWNGLEMLRMKLGLKLVTQKVNAAGHYLVLLGEKNADFDEIVDFLNASPIRYALTVFANMRRQGKDFSGTMTPLFATMLIQSQVDVGEGLGQPTEPKHTPTTASPSNIKSIPIIASSSQPQKTHKRRKTKRPTKISQSSGPTTLVADEIVHEERGDIMERVSTTATSLDAEQDSGNIIRTQSMATLNEPIPQGTGLGSGPKRQDTILKDKPAQTRFERLSKQSNDPPLSGVNTPGSGEDRLKIMEMIEICTKLSDRVLALENVKTAQDLEITSLKKRVKKLEKKKRQELHNLRGGYSNAPITTAGVSISTAEPSTPPTTTTVIEDEDLTIAQTLMKMRSEKSKEIAKERGSKEKYSESATRPTRGVTMQEPSEFRTRKAVPPSQHDLKDKGKAKMIELEKPLRKKDQIKFDKEMDKRLAEELEAELKE
ncbi:putative ribonuclease H-like domain-containing protein [Tanacetum coccineum]